MSITNAMCRCACGCEIIADIPEDRRDDNSMKYIVLMESIVRSFQRAPRTIVQVNWNEFQIARRFRMPHLVHISGTHFWGEL